MRSLAIANGLAALASFKYLAIDCDGFGGLILRARINLAYVSSSTRRAADLVASSPLP